MVTKKDITLEKSSQAVTFEEDENQGLVFNLNYSKALMGYCMKNRSMSDNNPSSIAKKWQYQNAVTICSISSLGENDQYETIASPVSNSEEAYQQSKHAYPKWRHTNHTIKSVYIQKALEKRAKEQNRNAYTINMRFSPKLAREIMAGGAAYIQSRLAIRLRRVLGYTPDMWLHLEATVSSKKDKSHNYKTDGKGAVSLSHGVLHMHGAVAVSKADLNAVKYVVRCLNSSSSSVFKNHEIHLNPIHDGLGWVDYCHKHSMVNNMLLDGAKRYSRTKVLGSVAQELYEEDRQSHKAKHAKTYGKEKEHV